MFSSFFRLFALGVLLMLALTPCRRGILLLFLVTELQRRLRMICDRAYDDSDDEAECDPEHDDSVDDDLDDIDCSWFFG